MPSDLLGGATAAGDGLGPGTGLAAGSASTAETEPVDEGGVPIVLTEPGPGRCSARQPRTTATATRLKARTTRAERRVRPWARRPIAAAPPTEDSCTLSACAVRAQPAV